MPEIKKILKLLIPLILIFLSAGSGCAPSKKPPYYEKRMKSSQDRTSQLGRNRYYYSPTYQKKLSKSYKRR